MTRWEELEGTLRKTRRKLDLGRRKVGKTEWYLPHMPVCQNNGTLKPHLYRLLRSIVCARPVLPLNQHYYL